MKKLSLKILFIVFICSNGYSQLKNEILISYGFAKNVMITEAFDGDMGFTGKKTVAFGMHYLRKLNNTFSFETGFTYSNSKITYDYFPSGIPNIEEQEIKLLSIPCGINLNFLKYFFINAGTSIDFEFGRTLNQYTHDQSGLGFYGGLGAIYSISNFSIKINPFILEHSVIQLIKQNHKQRLSESGLKIEIGYIF